MKSFPSIGSTQSLTLKSALLVYEINGHTFGESGGSLATVHEIGFDKAQRPLLLPGRPVSSSDMERLSSTLSKAAESMHWLPPSVLCLTASRMVWHVPGKRRRIWFNQEAKNYSALNGKEVIYPALLFDATINAGLRILAVASDDRPTPETLVYRAPFMNLYSLGEMCRGNSPMPKVFSIAAMKRYEASFFDSAFSHTNLAGGSMTRHPRGPVAMWRECRSLKKFPAPWLAPLRRAKGDRAHDDDGKVKTVADLLQPQKWTGRHPL